MENTKYTIFKQKTKAIHDLGNKAFTEALNKITYIFIPNSLKKG